MYNMRGFYTDVLLFYKLIYNEYKELYYYCIGTSAVPLKGSMMQRLAFQTLNLAIWVQIPVEPYMLC